MMLQNHIPLAAEEQALSQSISQLAANVQRDIQSLAGLDVAVQGGVVQGLTVRIQDQFRALKSCIGDLQHAANEQETPEQTQRVATVLARHQQEYESLHTAFQHARISYTRRKEQSVVQQQRQELIGSVNFVQQQQKFASEQEAVLGAQDVTASLRRTRQLMAQNLEQTHGNISVIAASNKRLQEAGDELAGQKAIFKESHAHLGTLKRQSLVDKFVTWGGFVFFMLIVLYISVKRTPAFMKQPLYSLLHMKHTGEPFDHKDYAAANIPLNTFKPSESAWSGTHNEAYPSEWAAWDSNFIDGAEQPHGAFQDAEWLDAQTQDLLNEGLQREHGQVWQRAPDGTLLPPRLQRLQQQEQQQAPAGEQQPWQQERQQQQQQAVEPHTPVQQQEAAAPTAGGEQKDWGCPEDGGACHGAPTPGAAAVPAQEQHLDALQHQQHEDEDEAAFHSGKAFHPSSEGLGDHYDFHRASEQLHQDWQHQQRQEHRQNWVDYDNLHEPQQDRQELQPQQQPGMPGMQLQQPQPALGIIDPDAAAATGAPAAGAGDAEHHAEEHDEDELAFLQQQLQQQQQQEQQQQQAHEQTAHQQAAMEAAAAEAAELGKQQQQMQEQQPAQLPQEQAGQQQEQQPEHERLLQEEQQRDASVAATQAATEAAAAQAAAQAAATEAAFKAQMPAPLQEPPAAAAEQPPTEGHPAVAQTPPAGTADQPAAAESAPELVTTQQTQPAVEGQQTVDIRALEVERPAVHAGTPAEEGAADAEPTPAAAVERRAALQQPTSQEQPEAAAAASEPASTAAETPATEQPQAPEAPPAADSQQPHAPSGATLDTVSGGTAAAQQPPAPAEAPVEGTTAHDPQQQAVSQKAETPAVEQHLPESTPDDASLHLHVDSEQQPEQPEQQGQRQLTAADSAAAAEQPATAVPEGEPLTRGTVVDATAVSPELAQAAELHQPPQAEQPAPEQPKEQQRELLSVEQQQPAAAPAEVQVAAPGLDKLQQEEQQHKHFAEADGVDAAADSVAAAGDTDSTSASSQEQNLQQVPEPAVDAGSHHALHQHQLQDTAAPVLVADQQAVVPDQQQQLDEPQQPHSTFDSESELVHQASELAAEPEQAPSPVAPDTAEASESGLSQPQERQSAAPGSPEAAAADEEQRREALEQQETPGQQWVQQTDEEATDSFAQTEHVVDGTQQQQHATSVDHIAALHQQEEEQPESSTDAAEPTAQQPEQPQVVDVPVAEAVHAETQQQQAQEQQATQPEAAVAQPPAADQLTPPAKPAAANHADAVDSAFMAMHVARKMEAAAVDVLSGSAHPGGIAEMTSRSVLTKSRGWLASKFGKKDVSIGKARSSSVGVTGAPTGGGSSFIAGAAAAEVPGSADRLADGFDGAVEVGASGDLSKQIEEEQQKAFSILDMDVGLYHYEDGSYVSARSRQEVGTTAGGAESNGGHAEL